MSKFRPLITECLYGTPIGGNGGGNGVELPNNIKVYSKKDVICYHRYGDNTTGELNEDIYIYDENPLFKCFQCSYSSNYRYEDNGGTYHNTCKCIPFVSIPTDNSLISVFFQTDSGSAPSNYEVPDDFVCIVKAQD